MSDKPITISQMLERSRVQCEVVRGLLQKLEPGFQSQSWQLLIEVRKLNSTMQEMHNRITGNPPPRVGP